MIEGSTRALRTQKFCCGVPCCCTECCYCDFGVTIRSPRTSSTHFMDTFDVDSWWVVQDTVIATTGALYDEWWYCDGENLSKSMCTSLLHLWQENDHAIGSPDHLTSCLWYVQLQVVSEQQWTVPASDWIPRLFQCCIILGGRVFCRGLLNRSSVAAHG